MSEISLKEKDASRIIQTKGMLQKQESERQAEVPMA